MTDRRPYDGGKADETYEPSSDYPRTLIELMADDTKAKKPADSRNADSELTLIVDETSPDRAEGNDAKGQEPHPQPLLISPPVKPSRSPSATRSSKLHAAGDQLKAAGDQLKAAGHQMKAIYDQHPNHKQLKRKLDSRLGWCLVLCFATSATVLCIYGAMHQSVYPELSVYINRTHQIAVSIDEAMLEKTNGTTGLASDSSEEVDESDKHYMTVDELQDYADTVDDSHATIWRLFWTSLLAGVLALLAIVLFTNFEFPHSKLVYRIIILLLLLVALYEFLQLLFIVLPAAYKLPRITETLLVEGYPRDKYARADLQSAFACSFDAHPKLVQLDLERPCLPLIQSRLMPVYAVLLLMFFCGVPFAFAIFTFAWDACIKEKPRVVEARRRVREARDNSRFEELKPKETKSKPQPQPRRYNLLMSSPVERV